MTKKDVLELKRRMKKNECTFTKLRGCYVNAQKEIVLKLNETFLNLEDDEFYKYLDIAKKTLSGGIGNNLMEFEFPLEEEAPGGKQQSLLALRESKLKNDELLDAFYQMIIDTYDYAGNYLILLYHDAYDVMTKTSDNRQLDESEEVYEYLICALCPVALSKPGLGYLEEENRIGPRQRDWVVGSPDTGFTFPAFTDRSTDVHSIMFYLKDAKEPHTEFIEHGFGCASRLTATQQKNTFQTIINKAIEDESERTKAMMDIQESLTQIIDEHAVYQSSPEDVAVLTQDSIQEILTNSGLSDEVATKIESAYSETFGDLPPVVDHLLDSKVLAVSAQKKVERALAEQVHQLQEKLQITQNSSLEKDDDSMDSDIVTPIDILGETSDTSSEDEVPFEEDPVVSKESEHTSPSHEEDSTSPLYDVILRVTPQKVPQIHSQIIDGKKCLVIPMDENEQANVNGVTTSL